MSEPLTFSTSLYTRDAVEAAVAAFAELASFEVSANADDVVVAVSEIDADLKDVLVDEFCNYALHETIVRARE